MIGYSISRCTWIISCQNICYFKISNRSDLCYGRSKNICHLHITSCICCRICRRYSSNSSDDLSSNRYGEITVCRQIEHWIMFSSETQEREIDRRKCSVLICYIIVRRLGHRILEICITSAVVSSDRECHRRTGNS